MLRPARQLLPRWEENPPLFFYFNSFSFRWVSCAKSKFANAVSPSPTSSAHLKLQPAHNSATSAKSQRPRLHYKWPLNCQPISNLGKPPFCKDNYKRESLNTKAMQASPTPDFCWAGTFNINFSLIEKLSARVKQVIDGCSGLCNCTYCYKLGISHFHSLKLILSSLSLSATVYESVNVWVHVLDLSNKVLFLLKREVSCVLCSQVNVLNCRSFYCAI